MANPCGVGRHLLFPELENIGVLGKRYRLDTRNLVQDAVVMFGNARKIDVGREIEGGQRPNSSSTFARQSRSPEWRTLY